MLIGDIATLLTAIFAAVAAGAAWATVATDWLRQARARQPNVSAGFLDYRDGRQKIELVNAGPGLAIQIAYLLQSGGPGGQRVGGLVGTGHLQAGERETVDLKITVPGKETKFVWVCRDVDQRLHIWSYDGRHERLKNGEYPNLGESFRRLYPDTPLMPRNIGMSEDPTQPGSSGEVVDPGDALRHDSGDASESA